ncbi:MAG: putative deacylase [Myxococcota bacterium]|jgi:predicted deacylase
MIGQHIDALDLDALPVGLHRLWLSIIHDGLGRQVRLPIMVAKGRRDGPVCGITSAVHGNEVNGIPVIHHLLHGIDTQRLKGIVVAVPVVNIEGFILRQRRTDDDVDLNHRFPGKADGREADIFVYRLMEMVIRKMDLLLDLHTASFGRVNCLYIRADMTDPKTARMAYLQRPQIIVHNPPHDMTLRGAAAEIGIPAITLEIGNPNRFQREYTKRNVIGIRAVMSAWGMLPKRTVALGEPPVVCASSSWMYTDHGGLLRVAPDVRDLVSKGDTVATVYNAFGDPARSYHAPHDGIVIGHSVDPVANTGARILHLGVVQQLPSFLPRED